MVVVTVLHHHAPTAVRPRLLPTVNVTIIPGHSRRQVEKLAARGYALEQGPLFQRDHIRMAGEHKFEKGGARPRKADEEDVPARRVWTISPWRFAGDCGAPRSTSRTKSKQGESGEGDASMGCPV